MTDEPTEHLALVNAIVLCPTCDSRDVKIRYTQIGKYICRSCNHNWIENPLDESTWAAREFSTHA